MLKKSLRALTLTAAAVGMVAVGVGAATATVWSPVANPSFRSPHVDADSHTRYGGDQIPGWTVTRGNVDVIGRDAARTGTMSNALDLNGNAPGAVEQNIPVTANQRVTVTFRAGRNVYRDCGQNNMQAFSVGLAGQQNSFRTFQVGKADAPTVKSAAANDNAPARAAGNKAAADNKATDNKAADNKAAANNKAGNKAAGNQAAGTEHDTTDGDQAADVRANDNRAGDAKATGDKVTDPKAADNNKAAADNKAADNKAGDAKAKNEPAGPKVTDPKAADNKAADNKANNRAAGNKVTDPKADNNKADNNKAADNKAAGNKAADNKAAGPKVVDPNAAGGQADPAARTAANDPQWQTYTYEFTTDGDMASLTFRSENAGSCGAVITDVRVTEGD